MSLEQFRPWTCVQHNCVQVVSWFLSFEVMLRSRICGECQCIGLYLVIEAVISADNLHLCFIQIKYVDVVWKKATTLICHLVVLTTCAVRWARLANMLARFNALVSALTTLPFFIDLCQLGAWISLAPGFLADLFVVMRQNQHSLFFSSFVCFLG